MQVSQCWPVVLSWQSSQTPPLTPPLAWYTAMSKWHLLEWLLQLQPETKANRGCFTPWKYCALATLLSTLNTGLLVTCMISVPSKIIPRPCVLQLGEKIGVFRQNCILNLEMQVSVFDMQWGTLLC